MKPKPLNKPRSPWTPGRPLDLGTGAVLQTWTRRVHDGTLAVFAGDEPLIGWHLSISFKDHRGEPSRYPTWDEIADARYQLLPGHLTFAMLLPPEDRYVSVMDSCFHLHQWDIPARCEDR